jgi:hypothetical protein
MQPIQFEEEERTAGLQSSLTGTASHHYSYSSQLRAIAFTIRFYFMKDFQDSQAKQWLFIFIFLFFYIWPEDLPIQIE